MLVEEQNLEYITEEVRRSRKWYFRENDDMYFSIDDKDVVSGYVSGPNLPNPLHIKNNLKKILSQGKVDPLGRVDADPVTYKLWDHWEKRSNV